MKKVKITVILFLFFLMFGLVLLLFTDFFTKIKLKKPVADYLTENYGIKKNDFNIISAYDNWLAGVDYPVYIEIDKPYYTISYLSVARNSYEIDQEGGEHVFLDIFKGAYIEQNKAVLKQSEKIIKKYHLLSESPSAFDIEKQNFYYYLEVSMDKEQEVELSKQFKKEKTLNTKELIKTLQVTEPRNNAFYKGVINFIYYYNPEKIQDDVPSAKIIMSAFKKSGVLTEGLYNIAIQPVTPTGSAQGKESYIVFRVNEMGEFVVIEENTYMS